MLDKVFGLWTFFSLVGVPTIWMFAKLAFKSSDPSDFGKRRRHIVTFVGGWLVFTLLLLVDPAGFGSAFIDS